MESLKQIFVKVDFKILSFKKSDFTHFSHSNEILAEYWQNYFSFDDVDNNPKMKALQIFNFQFNSSLLQN